MRSIRSRRFRRFQFSTLTGGSTAISTVPGLSLAAFLPATAPEFLITIGTIGRPVAMAIRKALALNGPTDLVSTLVPSGAIRMDRPSLTERLGGPIARLRPAHHDRASPVAGPMARPPPPPHDRESPAPGGVRAPRDGGAGHGGARRADPTGKLA